MKDILFSFARLATWKQQLVGGDQTHDALDDCRDLKEIIGRIAGDENRDMADVVRAGAISQEYDWHFELEKIHKGSLPKKVKVGIWSQVAWPPPLPER